MADLSRIDPQIPNIPFEDIEIMLVGEAPGRDEIPANCPFVGRCGQLLDDLLVKAGIDRDVCYVTNIFLVRPPHNNVKHFFIRSGKAIKEKIPYCKDLPRFNGMYLLEEYAPEIVRLSDEVLAVKPKVVIAFGATALWLFTGKDGITKERGIIHNSEFVKDMKIVPVFHPSYLLRDSTKIDQTIEDLKLGKSIC